MNHKKVIFIILVILAAAIILPLIVMLIGLAASRFMPLWIVALILLVVSAVIAWKGGVGREKDKQRDRGYHGKDSKN